MKHNPKVVSIDRSAAYVHHRAMKNRRDNNPVDALELLRSAVEQSPENREYKLDLAEMYCEMGCHEQSNRILLDLLAEKNAPAECYYGLALNQLGRNEMDSARRALSLYRSHAGGGEYVEDALDLTEEIYLYDALKRPLDRRRGRAAQIAEKACSALREDDVEKARRLFERSLEMDANQPEMRALYAMALRMGGADGKAVEQAKLSVSGAEPSVRALCVAAQVLYLCGDQLTALELARQAIAQRPDGVELRLMIFALSELGMYAEAADSVRLALQETPHDKGLLHMRAVLLHRTGAEDEQVERFWRRILRIDPDDSVARYYQELAARNELDSIKPELIYEVPAEEYRRRLMQIAEKLSEGLDVAAELWRTDRDFRTLLIWAVGTGNENCGRAAIMVIAAAGDEESESTMRELLYRGDVPMSVKLHGVLFLRLRGADMGKLMPPDMDAMDGLLPEAEGVLAGMPVGERQLVRFASEVLSQAYGVEALSALALLWRGYRGACGRNDPLVCTQEAAAALAWNYLLQHGRHASVEKLARQFACKPRRMVFYARHMASVLECYEDANTEQDNEDEDH